MADLMPLDEEQWARALHEEFLGVLADFYRDDAYAKRVIERYFPDLLAQKGAEQSVSQ